MVCFVFGVFLSFFVVGWLIGWLVCWLVLFLRFVFSWFCFGFGVFFGEEAWIFLLHCFLWGGKSQRVIVNYSRQKEI